MTPTGIWECTELITADRMTHAREVLSSLGVDHEDGAIFIIDAIMWRWRKLPLTNAGNASVAPSEADDDLSLLAWTVLFLVIGAVIGLVIGAWFL
jgi:hypothetical protein